MAYADPAAGKRRDSAYSAAAVTALTAASGTANNTVTDVGASFNQSTLNDNFKDVASKINEVITALKAAGILS